MAEGIAVLFVVISFVVFIHYHLTRVRPTQIRMRRKRWEDQLRTLQKEYDALAAKRKKDAADNATRILTPADKNTMLSRGLIARAEDERQRRLGERISSLRRKLRMDE